VELLTARSPGGVEAMAAPSSPPINPPRPPIPIAYYPAFPPRPPPPAGFQFSFFTVLLVGIGAVLLACCAFSIQCFVCYVLLPRWRGKQEMLELEQMEEAERSEAEAQVAPPPRMRVHQTFANPPPKRSAAAAEIQSMGGDSVPPSRCSTAASATRRDGKPDPPDHFIPLEDIPSRASTPRSLLQSAQSSPRSSPRAGARGDMVRAPRRTPARSLSSGSSTCSQE
jgi:hypothetical protein